jgi:uncharacterized RDD family membrane protein YckC
MIDSTNKQSPQEAFIIRRCLAALIDFILVYSVIVYISTTYSDYVTFPIELIIDNIWSISILLYLIVFTMSQFRGTIGKRLLNIKIVSIKEDRLKLYQIVLRALIQFISICILFMLGGMAWVRIIKYSGLLKHLIVPCVLFNFLLIYIPIFYSKSHLSLHDKISQTRIVSNKDSNKIISAIMWMGFILWVFYLFQ